MYLLRRIMFGIFANDSYLCALRRSRSGEFLCVCRLLRCRAIVARITVEWDAEYCQRQADELIKYWLFTSRTPCGLLCNAHYFIVIGICQNRHDF